MSNSISLGCLCALCHCPFVNCHNLTEYDVKHYGRMRLNWAECCSKRHRNQRERYTIFQLVDFFQLLYNPHFRFFYKDEKSYLKQVATVESIRFAFFMCFSLIYFRRNLHKCELEIMIS